MTDRPARRSHADRPTDLQPHHVKAGPRTRPARLGAPHATRIAGDRATFGRRLTP